MKRPRINWFLVLGSSSLHLHFSLLLKDSKSGEPSDYGSSRKAQTAPAPSPRLSYLILVELIAFLGNKASGHRAVIRACQGLHPLYQCGSCTERGCYQELLLSNIPYGDPYKICAGLLVVHETLALTTIRGTLAIYKRSQYTGASPHLQSLLLICVYLASKSPQP
jgi:hypothetical protein